MTVPADNTVPRRRLRGWPLLSLIALPVFAAAGAFALHEARGATDARTPAAPIASVITVRVTPEAAQQSRRLVAILRPMSETPYAFQVTGRVEARLVDVGDRVSQGQEIARLTRTDFDLIVQQNRAEVNAARQALETATSDEKRATSLRESGVASIAQLDAARSQLQEARARLDRSEAQLDIATNSLGYTTLRAGFDGIVTERAIEPGQIVAAGQTVLGVARTERLEVEVNLPEPLYAARDRIQGSFTPWVRPAEQLPVTLREASPAADPTTHTHRTRFALPPGALADLSFGNTGWLTLALPDEVEGSLLRLPSAALFDPGTGTGPSFWQVTDQQRTAAIPAAVQRIEGDTTLVRAQIDGPLNVVAVGANRLAEGQQVRPAPRTPQ
ncbi:efflux RND transporter periplasmic adaptor subunit [Paracoccus sulfuroxidans]|uniref:RND family efflux transporter MFP subunit n=1 Tax=Paracoccus sulfuroxidans TaxID=384678 RepID=A0A562P2S2_9RHOB|nr:efflux RND transporter periplasmic adaptor subunit [Paracoccus sulfuroxidans]TWI38286.1 RND family efflux transporter MFP subunit [Paracoccus sulfuroxidans]